MLVASDVAAILLALCIGLLASGAFGGSVDRDGLLIVLVQVLPLWVLSAYAANLYHDFEQRIDRNFVDESGRLVLMLMAWSWLFVMLLTVWTSGVDVIATSFFTWLFAVPLVIAGRAGVRSYASRQPWNLQPVALVGDETGLISLRNRIERHPEWRLDVKVEFLASSPVEGDAGDDEPEAPTPVFLALDGESDAVLDESGFLQLVTSNGVVRTMLVGGAEVFGDFATKTDLIQKLHNAGVGVDVVSGGPENLYSAALLQDVEGLPLVSLRPTAQRPFSLRMKRAFDLCVSIFSLLLFSPVMVWCAIRIRLESRGPVIFRQTRVGLNGDEFEIYKFRTMVEGAHDLRPELRVATSGAGNDDVLFKLEDDPRVTPVGRSLRRWSLDELPQFFNVIKGDMSMVGPRPLVPEEAAQVGPLFEARASVKPGIAGPWQALGRSSIPFSDMVKLDYTYAVGRSLTTDVYLLIRTFVAVVRRQGAH
jgi:exopolysaccharide biosynthesis polyprenyl glycosylphosphotransferase